ncbi:MAG: polysaccharide deacetylase family protein [Intrasporangium sp.]|uniref:polysaccharide deacetylase family protein n=1 Tax=Intrasporangium sp. TaxID=1925024 RepID=UPI0026478F55|nr:polysaccharide deacetylase family protein [Intrasporangium sp.]MDN5797387.1 polysaccharide deacetylase family protein [Intrasporangium sp.]
MPTETARSSPPSTTQPGPQPGPTAAIAPCTIPDSLHGVDVQVLPTTRKVVALTFDGDASNDGALSVLATLAREGVPATFFLAADFVEEFPVIARSMAVHAIGNRMYNQSDLGALTDRGIRTEIRSAAARIRAVTGQDPRPLLRFPDGPVDPHLVSLANAECYVPFRWTVDTLGWQGVTGGQSVETIVHRVLTKARPGEIVLMHLGTHSEDHSTLDADALSGIIAALRAKGYGFVTLGALRGSHDSTPAP